MRKIKSRNIYTKKECYSAVAQNKTAGTWHVPHSMDSGNAMSGIEYTAWAAMTLSSPGGLE